MKAPVAITALIVAVTYLSAQPYALLIQGSETLVEIGSLPVGWLILGALALVAPVIVIIAWALCRVSGRNENV